MTRHILRSALCLAVLAACGSERATPASDELQADVSELLEQMSALRDENARLHDDVRSLRADVAALRMEHERRIFGGDAGPRRDGSRPDARTVRVVVQSTPARANVFLDGNFTGQTPLALKVDAETKLDLRVDKPGFERVQRTLEPERDTTLVIRLAPR